MEKFGTLQEAIKSKIEETAKEFSQIMSRSNCIGYSFHNQKMSIDGNDLDLNSTVGLRMLMDGEHELMGAKVKYSKKSSNGSGKVYINLTVDYEMGVGRDICLRLSDTINFVEGDSRSRESDNKISTTNLIFNEVERMIAPIVAKSPMPFM
jgi:hypothetical protein